jgi:hypothetical protein
MCACGGGHFASGDGHWVRSRCLDCVSTLSVVVVNLRPFMRHLVDLVCTVWNGKMQTR